MGQGSYFRSEFFDVEKALALLQRAADGDDIQHEADSFIEPWQCHDCGRSSGCECDEEDEEEDNE